MLGFCRIAVSQAVVWKYKNIQYIVEKGRFYVPFSICSGSQKVRKSTKIITLIDTLYRLPYNSFTKETM